MNNYKKNNDNKRYYPLRDSKDPYKINLIQITEEQYRSLYPEIWRIQKREQYHHRCMCPKKYIWKCDGNCDLCEYHTAGDTLSLDANICSEGDSQFNILDSTAENNANVEEIILDKILMKQLIKRLEELMPEAVEIGKLRMNGVKDDDIAEIIGIKRTTFRSRLDKAAKKLRDEFGKYFHFE